MTTYDIHISAAPLDVAQCIAGVMSPQSGGIDIFVGTVRDSTKGRKVLRLEFEAYEAMALSEMQKIAGSAAAQWPLHAMLIHHRTGALQVGDIAVIIAVSAAHRDAAFRACRYAIDTLKQTVPIWKKEVFEDGEIWVAAHP
ncbi:molybdenum cofactor biosynthesis protein MoaE [Nemorincola caseinilytica]|uniref:Molybdopterin synthase catalytic subunit n=1 Tax=Nemorincola caseinilytica TaxID=2054315 RepID=A0ABP8N8U9_9BACT